MERRRTFDIDHVPHLDHAVRPSHARPAVITVAGDRVPDLVVAADAEVVGWAARIEDAIIVLGLDRGRADRLVLEFGP